MPPAFLGLVTFVIGVGSCAAYFYGANPFQIFFRKKVPQITGTILVVWTTITIVVLKVVEIIFAMTNSQRETKVLANSMHDKCSRAGNWGVGSAGAIVIMLIGTPILVWNVAKVFLIDSSSDATVRIRQMVELVGTRGGYWEILASSAFVSITVPLVVFISMKRFFGRGFLAGSVK